MKKMGVFVIILSFVMALAVPSAALCEGGSHGRYSGGGQGNYNSGGYGHYNNRGGYGHYRGTRHGEGWEYAGAALGGLFLGAVIASILSPTVYYDYAPPSPSPPPPGTYYYYPPPREYEYPY